MRKKTSHLTSSILETAQDMATCGVLKESSYKKITMRHLKKKLPITEPMTSEDIRSLRQKAHVSQAVFASHLNLTVGYISQLERGLKEPTGAVLTLLNIIRRKGFDVILH